MTKAMVVSPADLLVAGDDIIKGNSILKGIELLVTLSEKYLPVVVGAEADVAAYISANTKIKNYRSIEKLPVSETLRRLRSSMIYPTMWLTADPGLAAEILSQGLPAQLVQYPEYTRPEFRPDYKHEVVPWHQLIAEIDTQKALKNTDERLLNDSI